jgi:hypothetical protein
LGIISAALLFSLLGTLSGGIICAILFLIVLLVFGGKTESHLFGEHINWCENKLYGMFFQPNCNSVDTNKFLSVFFVLLVCLAIFWIISILIMSITSKEKTYKNKFNMLKKKIKKKMNERNYGSRYDGPRYKDE